MLLSEATDTRYEIVKILGQGGSATVYLARHIALNELRVLKILHHDMMMDARRREKFKLEAQVAAHLKHPAIVQVFDVTQTATKLQIEMEYLDGLSLRQHLERRHDLPLSVSLAVIHAILEGLEHAHRAKLNLGEEVFDGVIHRDLKPENIMVRKNGQPVICDFGVAKVGADLMTQTQHISGSVAYMAPERLRGELSTRSIDIFALGVMFFELHKGTRPFPGANKTQSLENILKWKILDLDAEWADSDPAVLQIIKKALARDPAQRYPDASQMLAALRPVYKLYHGETPPSDVVREYLDRGHFTTGHIRALIPEETPWKFRLGVSLAALALGAAALAGLWAWRQARTSAAAAAGAGDVTHLVRDNRLAEAEQALRDLPAKEQQEGYFSLARSYLKEKRDPGKALLLVNKALDLSYHPTIAVLKVEVLLDQDMLNLAQSELDRVRPWLPKMTRENQAAYYWMLGQVHMRRLQGGARDSRARAREAFRAYVALRPEAAEENLRKAEHLLRSLE